jgi:hypothetical protein
MIETPHTKGGMLAKERIGNGRIVSATHAKGKAQR